MIERTQESAIKSLIGSNKAIILMGARQVGKSTLLHSLLDGDESVLWRDTCKLPGLDFC